MWETRKRNKLLCISAFTMPLTIRNMKRLYIGFSLIDDVEQTSLVLCAILKKLTRKRKSRELVKEEK